MQTLLILILVGLVAYWFFSRRTVRAAHSQDTADPQAARMAEGTDVPEGGSPTDTAKPGMACHQGKGIKGLLGMAACCGAPIVLLLLLPFLGVSLGGAAGAALPYLALLACPVGMYFMMRFMMPQNPPVQTPENPLTVSQAPAVEPEIFEESSAEPPILLGEIHEANTLSPDEEEVEPEGQGQILNKSGTNTASQ